MSVFTKHIAPDKARPEPERMIQPGPFRPIVPPADPRSTPIAKLLDFVVNHWRPDTINLRSICIYGPLAVRNRRSAIASAEALVAAGWLQRIDAPRRDSMRWRIARGLSG